MERFTNYYRAKGSYSRTGFEAKKAAKGDKAEDREVGTDSVVQHFASMTPGQDSSCTDEKAPYPQTEGVDDMHVSADRKVQMVKGPDGKPKPRMVPTRKSDANDTMESVELEEAFSDKQIKMAYGIINDPRWKGGNMTAVVRKIEGIAKGLSNHPGVKSALRRTNEEVELDEASHVVHITSTDKSGKKEMRTGHVVAQSKADAVAVAKKHYQDQGHTIHAVHYGPKRTPVKEETVEEGMVTDKDSMIAAKLAKLKKAGRINQSEWLILNRMRSKNPDGALSRINNMMKNMQNEDADLEEAFAVNIKSGGKVPVGQHKFIYKTEKPAKYIENSIKGYDKDAKVVTKGDEVHVTATAGAHNSLIDSMRKLRVNGSVSEAVEVEEALKTDTKIRMARDKMIRDMKKQGKSDADIQKACKMNFPSLYEDAEVEEAVGTAAKYAGKTGVFGGKYSHHDRAIAMKDTQKFSKWRDKQAAKRHDQHMAQDPKMAKAGYAQNIVDTDKAQKKAAKKGLGKQNITWQQKNSVKREQVEIDEKTLTPAEMKKREEIAKGIEKSNPDMPMDKKMAIATAQAKKVAEELTPAQKAQRLKMITKVGNRMNKRNADAEKRAKRDAMRGIRKDKDYMDENSLQSFKSYISEAKVDVAAIAKELETYAKKSGGIDKKSFMDLVAQMKRTNKLPSKKDVMDMDTDPREFVLGLIYGHSDSATLKKHYGVSM